MNKNKLESIGELFRGRGYNIVIGTHHQQQGKWLSWYRGSVGDFHFFKRKTVDGITHQFEKKSLGMGKTVCEDFASQMFNEDSNVTVDNVERNEILQEVFKNNNFNVNLTQQIELYGAMGNSLMVEFIENGELIIDFINGDNFVFTNVTNNKIKGVLVLREIQQENDIIITHLAHHEFNEGMYTIEHEVFRGAEKDNIGSKSNILEIFSEEEAESMKVEDEDGNIRYIITHETTTPFFQHMKPNIANNYDIKSIYGISKFANCIDVLMSIDNKYDAYDAEFENGMSRILLDSGMTKKRFETDDTGNARFIEHFDKDQRQFMSVPNLAGVNQDKDPIKFYTPTLREAEFSNAISKELSILGIKVGYGKNFYDFTSGIMQNTATEVNFNNNILKTNIRKNRFILEKALHDMVKSIFTLLIEQEQIAPFNIEDLGINVNFSDAIIIDDEAELEKKFRLNALGMYPDYMLLMETLRIGEEEAKLISEEGRAEQVLKQGEIFGGFDEDGNVETDAQVGIEEGRESVNEVLLNGAQITSALAIVTQFNLGEVTFEGALEMLMTFLNIPEKQARIMLANGVQQNVSDDKEKVKEE
jgi:A118 family predicted phage portal protein